MNLRRFLNEILYGRGIEDVLARGPRIKPGAEKEIDKAMLFRTVMDFASKKFGKKADPLEINRIISVAASKAIDTVDAIKIAKRMIGEK